MVVKADRLSNMHGANGSLGFAILVLLPYHAVFEALPGCQPVIRSKGSSAVIGNQEQILNILVQQQMHHITYVK